MASIETWQVRENQPGKGEFVLLLTIADKESTHPVIPINIDQGFEGLEAYLSNQLQENSIAAARVGEQGRVLVQINPKKFTFSEAFCMNKTGVINQIIAHTYLYEEDLITGAYLDSYKFGDGNQVDILDVKGHLVENGKPVEAKIIFQY